MHGSWGPLHGVGLPPARRLAGGGRELVITLPHRPMSTCFSKTAAGFGPRSPRGWQRRLSGMDRKAPNLPLSPGRAERHGFEYTRHGTLSLYAALDTQSGEISGQTAERHTSQAFVAFLIDLLSKRPADQQVHIICDNLSAHKTKGVEEFLVDDPNVHLHFTTTYSSWLNRSNSGSPRSNAISSIGASSPP
jgi:hypothetical protein